MNMHILYNLRTKHNLEIDELAQQLNEKYGTKYEADFFDAPYEMFLESKVKEYQKHLEEVDIRMDK